MMSVATVSPILHNIDNLVGYLKRGRGLDSDYSDLGLIDQRAKRLKVETDVGISEEAGFAFDEKPRFSKVRYGYIPKGLALGDDEIDRLRNENTRNLLLNHKKLHLVLDLDHTLLNTTFLDEMSPEEEYLKTQTQSDHSLQYVHVVDTPSRQLMTKLRPYIRTFLVQASQMFELSIYTMGNRDYALEMAKLLDPGNLIFGGRVMSRDDSPETNRKSLDVLLARDSAVVILDDRKNVWTNDNRDNVIVMPRYHFFRSSYQKSGLSKGKPYSELKTDECDRYGGAYLANVLQLLGYIHTIFFNEVEIQGWDLMYRDVRLVLKILKKEVLKGCKIVFSHVFPSNVEANTHPLWKMAEQLGATCSTQVDPSVTHVVAANARTQKSCWAVKEGKFLVNPQWIHSANFMWQKQPEDNFPCH
ncbi:RNA polymerase II C-terminal domain phosphatase-like 4 [Rosa chinensis]|nr:RNA polymerase II C-terminal domain phosphatase-like 4 [Rosa chinensis]